MTPGSASRESIARAGGATATESLAATATRLELAASMDSSATKFEVVFGAADAAETARAIREVLALPAPGSASRESIARAVRTFINGRDLLTPADDEALADALLALLAPPEGWRDIESAPRDGTPILLWYPNERITGGEHVAMARWQKGLWSFQNHASWGATVKDLPTHWMPLPPPPTTSGELADPPEMEPGTEPSP